MTVATQDRTATGISLQQVPMQLAAWLVFGVFAVICLIYREQIAWLGTYPDTWLLNLPLGWLDPRAGDELWIPFQRCLELFMDWVTVTFKEFFRFISAVLEWPMKKLEWLLH